MDFYGIIEIDFDGSKFEFVNIQCKFIFKGYVIVCCIIGENFDVGFKFFFGNFIEFNFCFNFNVWGYFFVFFVGGFYEYVDF